MMHEPMRGPPPASGEGLAVYRGGSRAAGLTRKSPTARMSAAEGPALELEAAGIALVDTGCVSSLGLRLR